MKKLIFSFVIIICAVTFGFCKPNLAAHAKAENSPVMSIVIDDFGSYDESGVEMILGLSEPITCAVIPETEITQKHLKMLSKTNHEVILHMPMESHVHLPENWYGSVYIKNSDTAEIATKKLDDCIKSFPKIKGFNIHIGSGVSRNKPLMTTIYEFAKQHNLYFLDSRTIETKATEDACDDTNSIYLGRDVFLEADKNRSYSGVIYRLDEGIKIAKEKGYSILIGHVGAEGGTNTANAIKDSLEKIKAEGVKIVPLSEIYEMKKSGKLS